MLILGIETSCDETSAAVIEGMVPLSNVVLSQQEHGQYGGVVPELASRAHIRTLVPVIEQALVQAGADLGQLEGIAVTNRPGLVGSLIVGVNTAKGMALARNLPFIGVNHLEGHVFSNLIEHGITPPFLCLLVSGGHTELLMVNELGSYQTLGRTLDDAAGESFDKVAKLLGLLSPGTLMGGRLVSDCAANGDESAFDFPRALNTVQGGLDFSFSGLKTAVLNQVNSIREAGDGLLEQRRSDIAASFQAAVVDVLVSKTLRAVELTGVKVVTLAGGVAANGLLRRRLSEAVAGLGGVCHIPSAILCTDNAAMIAAAGCFHLGKGRRSGFDLDAVARSPL